MTCKNCGATIPEGQTACADCGTPVVEVAPVVETQGAETAAQREATAVLTETEAANPPKSRRKLGWLIALAAAVVIIAGVALAWGHIGNLIDRTFSSPVDYYHQVETRALNSSADALADPSGVRSLYGNMLGMSAGTAARAVQGSVTFAPGEGLISLLSDSAGVDLSWLKSAGIRYVTDPTQEDLLGVNAALQLNGADLLNLEGMYQRQTLTGYFRVPELSQQYASVDMEELLSNYYWEHGNDSTFQMLSSLLNGGQGENPDAMRFMPDGETISAIVERYAAIVINDLTDVERSGASVTAGDITAACTALTVRADKATLEKILRDIFTAAADDPDIKEVVYALCRQLDEDGDRVYQEFQESMHQAVSEETLIEGDMNAVMTVYVDGKGEITGRDIQLTGDSGPVMTFRYVNAVKGSRFGTEFLVDVPDKANLRMAGGGTNHGGRIQGELGITLTADGVSRELCTVALDGTAKDNNFRGEITLTPSEELLNTVLADANLPAAIQELVRGLKLTIVNQSDGDQVDVKLVVKSGDSELLTVLVESSPADALGLTVPTQSVKADEWAGTINQLSLLTLMGNLQKAGIPMSFFSGLLGNS